MVPAALFREERERHDALARELRDTAALVGMLRGRLEAVEAERDRLLAISAESGDAPTTHNAAPVRGDVAETTQEAMAAGQRATGAGLGALVATSAGWGLAGRLSWRSRRPRCCFAGGATPGSL